MKTIKLFVIVSLFFLTMGSTIGQVPVWTAPFPTVTDITAINGVLNVNLTNLPGTVTVYYVYWRYPAGGSPAQVKTWSAGPFDGNMLGGGSFTYSLAEAGTLKSVFFENLLPGRPSNTMLVTVEYAPNVFLNTRSVSFATPVCPTSIYVETGFDNNDRCVNDPVDGARKIYSINTFSGYSGLYSNILEGAVWTINWGDGSPDYTFTSLYNNDGPGVVILPGWERLDIAHSYVLHDSCYRDATLTVVQPNLCSPYGALQETKSAILAGRDWDPDGNGDLVVADVLTGVTDTIYVCEGHETNVQIQDISTWDCQPGSYPEPPGEANDDPRTLQWVYGGQLPDGSAGVNLNTITGNVAVGAIGTAFRNGVGVIGDTIVTETIGYLSEILTIPATCIRNEILVVYFKNWNKCNPFVGTEYNNSNYINTEIVIKVIPSPPPPDVDDKEICVGDNRTLSVNTAITPPFGTISWYNVDPVANPAAVAVGTGTSYTTPIATAGLQTFWVVDGGTSNHGVTCTSQPSMVTLMIRDAIANNTIADAQTVCINTTPAGLTGTPPTGGNGVFTYLWERSTGGATGPWNSTGVTTQDYSPGVLAVTTWYRRIVTSLSTCTSTSNVIRIQVTPNNTITRTSVPSTTNQTVCINTPITQIRYTTTGATGATFSGLPPGVTGNWAASVITINGSPTSTAGSPYDYTITLTGGCGTVTATGTIRVNPLNTVGPASSAPTLCVNTPLTAITHATTGATGIGAAVNLPAGVTAAWAGNTITITGTPTASGTFNYSIPLTGGCGSVSATGTITVNPLPVPTITGPSSVCPTSTHNYTTEAGMTGYIWTVSAGGSITAGAGTNTITVSWTGTGSQSVRVTYTNSNLCTGISPLYSVIVGDLPTGANITGSVVCIGSSSTIRVTLSGGAPDYTILIPEYSATAFSYVSGTDINLGPLGLGNHTYTLSSAQDACGKIVPGLPKTATATVNANNTISRTSAVGTDNQTVCINTPITNITYATTGATGATITGLPTGVTGGWAGNVVTISGTPSVTAGSPYTYTITLTGGCGTVTATGTIRVNPNNTIARTSAVGTDNQTVCINTPIINITYATTGATGATITGLPTGVTGGWAGNVVTISGTPSVTAGSPYTYTITLTGGCGTVTATGTIRVNPNNTIARTSAVGTDNQTVCINTPIINITYATTGATGATITGLPTGVTGGWAGNVVTISGTPSVTAGSPYTYTITLTGGCGTVTATGTIRVNPNNTIARTSAVGTDNQTVCINTPITNITYATTGATGATITGLPTGVTGGWAGNVVTISGTPSVTAGSPYTYTITLTGGCGTVTATGTIRVNPNNTIARTSAVGTDNQTVCINTPIINITYATTGATGATITGLPTGVTGGWAGNVVTISGTPSVTAGSPYTYTITLTGGCGTVTATGTIRVNPNNTIARTSAVGTDNQTVCINTPITNITYATTGATGATITGLPTGVTGGWAGNVVTISGTPSVTAGSPYTYTITLTGGCGTVTATGTIRVNPNNTIARTSAVGTDNQTVCINTPITNITYATTGATGATITGLPTGVTGGWAGNVVTISGTPSVTAGSPYTYTITLTGGCGTVTATGTIRVNPNNTIARTSAVGTDNQTVCINTPITNITYATTGATGATITGLPTGVTGGWAGNVVTISGTPSVTTGSPYTYTITLTGGCGTVTATGTIRVNPNNTIARTSAVGTDNQTVCINTPITNITYATTGATGATITGLPTGVTGGWAGNVVTISGTPSVTTGSPFSYTITTTGGCGTATTTGTISVISNNTINRTSAVGTDNQTVCINTPITNITYATTGATGATITGLPTGVTGGWAGNVVTISGTPSVTAGSPFTYTITLTGGCGIASATGTVTVIETNTVGPASSTPTLCVSSPLTAITHATTGATGIGVATGLPAGVTAGWAANTITITGTPTASGVFNYSIPLTGGCGSANATGTITVITNNTVSAASSTPALCINTPLTAITHTTTGATGIGAAVDLPSGVTAAWAANTITITGTPTVSGVFNYSIPLTGGCGTAAATGTITVVSLPATPAITGPTVICGAGAATHLYQIDNGSYLIAGNEYVWTVPAGATPVAGGGLTDNFILLSFAAANTYIIQVTENTTSPLACYGIPQTYTVNVYNNPVPNAGTPETICQGDAAILGGTPNGVGPSASGGTGIYSYSWLPTYGLNDPSAEHPSANPAVTMAYQLMVTDVTSGCVSTAPSSVVLTVNPAPAVIMPPLSQIRCAGDVAVFGATVSGNSYQWEISTDNGGSYTDVPDNATYDNVTSTSLTVNSITLSMSGHMYRLRVMGLAPCAPVHTSAAILTVNNSPAVTLHPLDATVCETGFATFTSTASDALTYQWYVSTDGGGSYNPVANGGNYFGANTTTLNVLNIPFGFNNYRYRMVATGLCNPVATSNAAILTVDTKVVITSQPAAVTRCEGLSASFSVAATGTGLSYQWLRNGIMLPNGGDISGATSATLTINNIETGDEANYSVAVTGTCSAVVSNAAPLNVDDNAVITMQPVNTTRCEGTTATFSVTASGTGLSYRWRKGGVNLSDGGNISGALTATLTINNVATADEGSYDVVITGLCSNVTSAAALLGVDDNAVITTHPTDFTACEGLPATFSVTATGTNLTYRWRKDGINLTDGGDISGATSATLSIATIATADEGLYDVVITGLCSTVTSNGAQLSVNDNIVITGQPVNVTQCEGTDAVFTVVNTGTGPVTYQWYKGVVALTNVGNISGATTATLTVSDIATADEGSYSVTVTGLCSTVTSGTATLGVDDDVVITVNPVAVTQCEGTTAMFSVTATGTGLSYQWRRDGVNLSNTPAISGVYTSTLTINNIQTANEGTYDVVVSGTCVPATSSGALLAVDDKPVITLQPVSVVQCEGTTAVYSVTATGTGLTYQWRKGGVDLINLGDITGATSATLNIANIETADEGSYDVVITSTCGTVTSSVVQLTVDDDVVITVQPVDVTQCEGTLASFTVSATGTGPLTYRWRKNGVNLSDGGNITGSATTNLRISNISTADEANYTVVVTGKCTGATSSVAALSVDDKVVITAQPVSVTQCEGTMATFSVTADGTDLLYQWRKGAVNLVDGGDINGATLATLTIDNIETADEGLYYVVITGKCSSEISTSVPLSVDDNAVITIQPVNTTRCEGTTATFSVTASGTGLSYRWRKGGVNLSDGGNISGALTATLTINNVATADEGSYDVVITGLCSNVTSAAALLGVDDNAVITTHPTDFTACEGLPATFSVTATGTNLTYRWRKDGINLTDGGDISGATSATLSIATIATADEGLYDVVITGLCSTVTSNGAQLSVNDNIVITGQPVNVTQCEGTDAVFTVVNTGTGPVTYQWYKGVVALTNVGNISGATTATLTVSDIATADEGSYSVTVTGLCSTVTSGTATLGVDDDVVITVNPVAVTQCEGTTAMFSVTATGTGLSYQWRRDGVNLSNTPAISGVYTSTLTINNIQTANEGTYDVVVSGTCVPATSSGALLAVDDKPVITLQPVSVVQCEGTTAVYSVTATGTGLTYQWRKGGVDLINLGDITGATSATLNIANIETADEGSYDVVITSTCGTVTSSVVQLTVDDDVVITVQPVDVTQCEGTLASFTVSATGTGPLTYRWRKNGVNLSDGGNITGSATTNLRISNISTADEANYTVVVTGKCTGATSSVAALSVDDKVVITAQPVSVTQCEGTMATFSVTADGTDLLYQWRKGAVNLVDGGDINGATLATLTIDNIETADEGLYYVVITGKCSSEISTSVPLSVDDNAVITIQPVNTTRCEGTTATFSVTATGTGLSYRWRKGGVNLSDGGNISGALTATLTINNVATADEGSYDVVITGLCSNVTSAAALLGVDDNAVITTHPTDFTACEGLPATFSVTATGTNLTYRWRKDGVNLTDGGDISGATSATLTIATIATSDEGLYDVVITGLCSTVTSNGALLGVDDNVVITTQPVNVTTCEGDAAIFSVTVTGTGPITYQWRRNGVNLSDGGDISGSLTSTLTIANTEAADMGSFDVIITGLCSNVTSSAVTLTVSELPEIITQPVPAIVCAGENAVFTADAGITTNPVYQWYVNPGSGWTPAVGARYQGATTDTLTVVSALEIMSGYQYRLRVSGSCTPYVESNIVTLTVTRQAEITQHPVSVTVCETDPVSFTVNAGLTTNPSYQWEISTNGGLNWAPIPGANSATFTIASAASADNGHAFRAVVSSTCGSSVTSFPAFLTVNELPEIIDQPDDVIICEYAIADFIVDAGVTTGATYQWERSDDNGTTWNPLNETATYFGVSTRNLKVNGTQRLMNGDQFRAVVSGICTPAVTSDPAILTVNYAPEILVQPVAASICENTPASFTVSAQGTAPLSYQWFVDTGGGAGFEIVSNGGVYAGATTNTLTLTNVPRGYDNYRYRVEVTGVCLPIARSATVQLDVSIETIINTQPADSTICEFMTASFTALADGANLTYQWQAFISGTWTDLTNTGLYIGVQTPILMVFGPARTMDGTRFRVIIGSDCSADLSSDEAVLTVFTAPELSDHPDEFRGCPGGNATFSVVAAGDNLVYQWQVNTGSGFNNVTDNATYSGTDSPDLTISNLDLTMNGYLVRAVVSGTCLPPVTSSFAPLRVYMEPSIVSEPADAEVCNETGVVYYAQVFNTGAGETTVWQVNQGAGWNNLSDGVLYQGTQTPQLVIMSADTTMTGWHYRLEITGPCDFYYTREALLTVNAPPRAYIANVDTLLVCGGIPTQLNGNPAGGSLIYDAHRWFGDIGPLSAYNIVNPVFNTTMPGYYRLIYQVTDSKRCVGLDTLVIQVEKPVAMFTVSAPSGCQPLTVNFTNGSTGYASLLWNFGDTTALSTELNPQHTYYNAGPALAYFTAELEVTSANGCVSTMTNGITVYPEILSDFTVSDDTICSGETVTFSLLPGAFRYYWSFGDGQSENGSNVINHVYMNTDTVPVTYDVILTTESFFGCQSADTMQVVVYPTPVPNFTAAPVSQTFPNSTVTFTNTTNPGIWIWAWDFDDGNNSTVKSPVHTYAAPGEYAVSLTVSNDVCTATVTHNISVLPTPPIAAFDSIPSGCMPWNIKIHNTSLYATSYYWDFGDGYTSNAENPDYTYLQAGSYLVTLTVQGPGGSDTEQQMVYVYQAPRAYFEVSPPKVYVNDEKVRMFNLTEGADSFVWEFGDGDTSHVRDPYHKYTTEGIYDITLHAYSANGCYDTYILSPAVTVEPFGKLVFATVFKPNQDGPIDMDELPTSGDALDQFFFPPIRETVLNYHMQIFNRWGTMIFETYDINKPWNGYYKGKLCAQGVYVWLVEGKYANGRPFKEAGDITLLH